MTNSSISPFVNSKDGVDVAMLFTLWSSGSASGYDPTGRFQLPSSLFELRRDKTTQHVGQAGGLQILRC